MTEAEWLTPGDLRKHVALMWSRKRARKLRLFGVACCRPLEPWLNDPVMAKARSAPNFSRTDNSPHRR